MNKKFLAGVLVTFVFIAIAFLALKGFTQPLAIPAPLNKTITLNSNSGILIINISLSNPVFQSGPSIVYQNYTIISATEQLPNGTIINASKSYAERQLQMDCQEAIGSDSAWYTQIVQFYYNCSK